ncbi:MAG: four helix bundle protein [Bacteroidota bacterium]
MTTYKNLEAWKKSMLLVKEVYELTKLFPKEELYALSSQAKRAVVSIPSNIAEGCGRQYKRDTKQFLHIARGSLYELETILYVAVSVDILNSDKFETLTPLIDENMRILNGLINRYERDDLR